MPRRGLNVGTGIAAGVNGFLDSYMRITEMKQREKLQENAFIVSALTKQLEDDTLPLYQRAKILDSIPKLVGIKNMDKRLSEMLGLDDYLLNTPQENQKNPDKLVEDTSVQNPEMASSITLKGTQQPVTKTVGDLTPLEIRKKINLEVRKAEDERDFEKQAKLLKLNYDLQMDSLKGTGFTKEVFRGYDRNGNYIVTMINQKGERKDIFLGDVDSEAVTKAGITSNKPSKFLQERERYWLNQVNPETGMNYSEEEANIKALEDANKQFQLGLQTKEAYKTSVTQGITGTKPIQPSQSVDDRRALAERRAILQANINTARQRAIDSSNDASNKTSLANKQWTNVVEPIKREMQKWLDDGGETTDREYTIQQSRLNTEIDRYNDLKRAADDAVSRDKSMKEAVGEAETILNEFNSGVGTSSSPSPVNDNMKKAIDLIRKNNPKINDPNSPSYMTDSAIIEYLRRKGKIQ